MVGSGAFLTPSCEDADLGNPDAWLYYASAYKGALILPS